MTDDQTSLPSRPTATAGEHATPASERASDTTTRAATHPAGQGHLHADDCAPETHWHVGLCQRTGYALGRADSDAELVAAAQGVLRAWGDWASTVTYDRHDPARVALRRAMEQLAGALPEGAGA